MGIYTYRYWDGKMGHPEHIIQYIMNYTYYISGGETGIPKSAVRVAARFKKIQRERERESITSCYYPSAPASAHILRERARTHARAHTHTRHTRVCAPTRLKNTCACPPARARARTHTHTNKQARPRTNARSRRDG